MMRARALRTELSVSVDRRTMRGDRVPQLDPGAFTMRPVLYKAPKRRVLAGAAAAAVVAGLGAGVAYYRAGYVEPQVAVNLPKVTPQVMAFPRADETPASVPQAQALLAPARENQRSMQIPVGGSKAKQFDRLAKGTTEEKYQAYKLAEACLLSRLLPKYNPALTTDPAVCGDLQPGQVDMRVEQLKPAALAGVHGAWWALKVQEGPGGGFPNTLPDNEETRKLLADAHAAAMANADPTALTGEVARAMKAKNYVQALTYHTAFLITSAQDLKREGTPNVEGNPLVMKLASQMPAADATKAIAQGRDLAKRRQRS